MINAIIWFLVSEEAKSPIAENAAARNIAPMYPPRAMPQSISPRNETKIPYDKVGIIMIMEKMTADKNLPITTSRAVTGSVRSISYEPVFSSSENSLMVTAGITNDKIIGSHEK